MNNNQMKKAIEHLEDLLKLNSNNAEYYKLILKAEGIEFDKEGNDEQIVEILNKYEEVLPKSNTHVRLAMTLLSAGPVFE